MSHRRFLTVLATVSLFAFIVQTTYADINPVLTRAVSRKLHGGAPYDIPLPLSGSSGIECRRILGNATIIFFFDQPVTGATAAVTTGTGAVSGTPTAGGNALTVNLTGVADQQELTLTLSNVASTAGGNLASASVNIRFMEGDTNGNGMVTVADVGQTKAAVGQPFSGFYFREDLNMNGALTAADVSIVKAKVGTKILTGGSAANTPPTISNVANTSTKTGAATVTFTIGDAESDVNMLALKATSDNPTLLPPNTAFAFQGSGSSRTLTITAAPGQTGTANITITVGDGMLTASDSFALDVQATPQLYIAYLYPPAGLTTQGAGTALLKLDGDESAATVDVNLSNLNGTVSTLEVRANGSTLVNLNTITPDSDGNYRWVFPAGSAGAIASAIKNNQASFVVTTSASSAGEVSGPFNYAGSTYTFTPPAPVALITSGPATQQDAARFLSQATFGPSTDTITDLMGRGYENWLANQFNSTANPPTLSYPVVYQRCTTSSASGDALSCDRVEECWWKNAITAPDQLRQRIATAYSEIFVVSYVDDNINAQPAGLATFYDLLINDAFVNFRTLLEDVTLHPIMGQYLNMRGNVKPKAPNYTSPNENYAREVMQLFSIGLNQLNPDGTLKFDIQGNPIPTYDQNVIQGFAQVFTGWNTDPTPVAIPTSQPAPATQPLIVNSYYNKPMVVTAANHSNYSKLLLNGYVIPANASQTVASCNAELDAALDDIFNHPNVGPFISRELIQRLVCSNPSPAYVYRVASVFNNDGTGVRGNMQAVIRAILLDPEARLAAWTTNPGYGHLREPMIRAANIIRAFHPTSTSGYFKVGRTDTELAQTPFRSTTVFNFFEPGYGPPGILSNAGMVAPEFEINNETTSISAINFIYSGIYTSTGWKGADTKCNFATEQTIAAHPSTGTTDLIEDLNFLLMSGQMPQAMKDRIATYINSITVTNGDYGPRVKAAIYLVATSPQFNTQR